MSNEFKSFTYTQEYKNERYANLKVGDEVYLNIAHFQAESKEPVTAYCNFGNDEYWDKDTDCSYMVYDLYNDKDEYSCESTIFYPQCCCKVIAKTDTDITLKCCESNDCNQFKLTKEELFIAATKYDGWEWEITF